MRGFLIRLVIAAGIVAVIYFSLTGVSVTEFLGEKNIEKVKDFELVEQFKEAVKRVSQGDSGLTEEATSEGEEMQAQTTGGGGSVDKRITEEPEEQKGLLEEIFEKLKPGSEKESETALISPPETLNLPAYTSLCFPSSQMVCVADDCKAVELDAAFTLLDSNSGIMGRCSGDKCESYTTIHKTSGLYEHYQPETPTGFMLVKEAALPGKERTAYVAVSAEGITTTIYSGSCLED